MNVTQRVYEKVSSDTHHWGHTSQGRRESELLLSKEGKTANAVLGRLSKSGLSRTPKKDENESPRTKTA